MICEPISELVVLAMMRFLAPSSPHACQYPEISQAIAMAANQDPLFPFHIDGCRKTAAVLVAVAWHRSRFHPNKVFGPFMGLYQVTPPNSKIDGKLLLLPRNSSLIAIDILRTGGLPDTQWRETAGRVLGIDGPRARMLPPKKEPT